MNIIVKAARGIETWRSSSYAKFTAMPKRRQSAILWSMALSAVVIVSIANPDPAYAQNLESFASKVRALLSSALLRTLAVNIHAGNAEFFALQRRP